MNDFKPTNILFLDHDGVMNSQLYYNEYFKDIKKHDNIPLYKTVRKLLRKVVKAKEISMYEYYKKNKSV